MTKTSTGTAWSSRRRTRRRPRGIIGISDWGQYGRPLLPRRPGESWDPPINQRIAGQMDPGFRRDDVLFAYFPKETKKRFTTEAQRHREEGIIQKVVIPAKAGIHPSTSALL